jgi:hypothetical protein
VRYETGNEEYFAFSICRHCKKTIKRAFEKDSVWFHPHLTSTASQGIFCDGWPYTTSAEPLPSVRGKR